MARGFRKIKPLVTDAGLEQARIRGETPVVVSGPGGTRIVETPTEYRIKEDLKKRARDVNALVPSEHKPKLPG